MSLLEHQLTDYAYKLINGGVKQEYANSIVNWQKQANEIIAYAKRAFKNHELTLTRIKEEQRAEQEFVLLALSLLAGPAISFVAGTLQYRLAPKIFGNRTSAVVHSVPNPKYVPPAKPVSPPVKPPPQKGQSQADAYAKKFKYQKDKTNQAIQTVTPGNPQPKEFKYEVFDPDWSRTEGKVFGDFGGSLVHAMFVNPAFTPPAPSKTALEREINLAANSTDLESLESNINNAILEGKKLGETAIANHAGTILKDHEFGRKWLKNVQEATPGYLILNDQAIRRIGDRMIHNAVDEQRRKWAKEWFYFGNQPQQIFEQDATVAIEVEIWRLWILREDFRLYEPDPHSHKDDTRRYFKAKGFSGIVIDKILNRLFQLGVLAGRNTAEKNRRARVALPPAEVKQIEGSVDSKAELDKILIWAAKREPEFLAGKIPYSTRASAYLPLDPANVWTW